MTSRRVVRSRRVLIEGELRRLGQRLRDLRSSAGETQAAAADAVGLARPYLSAVEAGRKNITLETLYALAEHFGVDATELLRPDQPEAEHKTGTNTGRN
jgi:transcriptional regulator with XRE-family HTH domain